MSGDDNSSPSDTLKRADHLSPGSSGSGIGRIPYRDLQHLYETTVEQLKKISNEKDEIQHLASQRALAFQRSEDRYKEDMKLLETRLAKMGMEDVSRMEPLRNLHGNIQDTINSIQNKTARVLQDQERDLIRAFRARLADVTVELENERKKNESGSAEWVARCRKLTEELEWLRDLTDKLTSENKSVLKDNRRFKRQMKTQEEDREFLIKQLVSVKKENARLRYSFDQVMAGNIGAIQLNPDQQQQQQQLPGGQGTISSITGLPMSNSKPALRAGTPDRSGANTPFGSRSLPSRPQSAFVGSIQNASNSNLRGSSRPGTATGYPSTSADNLSEDKERRYNAMISKLQKQVEESTRNYRQLRTAYTNELSTRTELQGFVKKCIDDVRQDMAERGRSATLRRAQGAHRATSAGAARKSQPLPPPLDPRAIPLSEFTPTDRINVMEWLMSQDQVIFMLYDKIFPQRPVLGGGGTNSQNETMDYIKMGSTMNGQQQSSTTNNNAAGPAPGSLFGPRPSSSPSMQAGASGGQKHVRPQTVGPGQTRSSASNTSSSIPQHPQSAHSSTSSSGKPSQYERPLGSRPLSGYEHSTSAAPDTQFHTQPQRPHTAGYSSSSSSSSRSAMSHPHASHSSQSQQPTAADIEAELMADRAQRLNEEEDEEDDRRDEEDEQEYNVHRSHFGDTNDSFHSEDGDDRLYAEQKEER